MLVTLDMESDTIIKIRGAHSHENKLLASLDSNKVAVARKNALEGAYSKPRVVYWPLTREPPWGLVSFIIYNCLNSYFIIFIILGMATSQLCTVVSEEAQEILPGREAAHYLGAARDSARELHGDPLWRGVPCVQPCH